MPHSDGISPTSGADRIGPTAAIKSVNAIDHVRCTGGVIYNQMFSPSAVSTDAGIKKWIDLIRTHIALDNGQIQFNVIDEKTLLDAQKNPEKYKGLLIRVAGYTSYFVELDKEIQDDIINRTTQKGLGS
jgi:formate C-acetyltransferase